MKNGIISDDLIKNIQEFQKEEVDKISNKIKIHNYSSDKSKTQTIEISGNKASLMRVGAYVADIALNGNFNGCHYDLGSWFFDEYDAELTIKLEIP